MSRIIRIVLAVLVLSAVLSTPTSARKGVQVFESQIVVAAGGVQGVYYTYGATLAAELNRRTGSEAASVLATGGSIDNLRRLHNGQVTLAFTAADAATDAVEGRAPFQEPVPLRTIGRIYDDYIHLVAAAGSTIHRIEDLRGKAVSLGPPGSGTALIARRLLGLRDIAESQVADAALSIDDSVAAFRRGAIDAFFWSGGIPTSSLTELARSPGFRLIPLGELAPAMRSEFGSPYRAATIPQATYQQVGDTPTLAVPNYLVTLDTTSNALVYGLTRILFEEKDALTAAVVPARSLNSRSAIFTGPVPIHPGAQRYYREIKP